MRGRKGTNKTHNNQNQKGGWYRSSNSGYTTYSKRIGNVWQSYTRLLITRNHKSLYGTKYHNNSTFWVCEWTGERSDGSKWHYIMVFPSLKAAKELRDWRDRVVVDVLKTAEEKQSCGAVFM